MTTVFVALSTREDVKPQLKESHEGKETMDWTQVSRQPTPATLFAVLAQWDSLFSKTLSPLFGSLMELQA